MIIVLFDIGLTLVLLLGTGVTLLYKRGKAIGIAMTGLSLADCGNQQKEK
jgi:hypothetical protein